MKPRNLIIAATTILTIHFAAPPAAHAAGMTVQEVLSRDCTAAPSNFSLNQTWNERMGVLPSFCDHPEITEPSINGQRKPKAYVYGAPGVRHDLWAASILNGNGTGNPDDLGISPNTEIEWGDFCNDALPILYTAREGDVVFSLRQWNPAKTCQFLNPQLKTIPVVGLSNERVFVGDERKPGRIQVYTGSNY